MQVRQSTATTILIGPVLDANGAAKTDEAVASVQIHKNGGAAAALDGAATLTHSQTGFYRLALTTTDLNTLGTVEFSLNSGTNSMPVRSLNVLTQDAYDALHHAADGSLRAALIDGAITAAKIGADAITNAKIADNAIAVENIAADAITAAKVAADVHAEAADAVWDETLADHLGVGSTGEALNAAGAAGDPWTTALPGAYGAGSAGKIIGDNINAPIATVDTVVDAIKLKTDNLPASPAAVGSEMALSDGAIVAAKIGAAALDGKGDWNTTTPPTAAAIRTEVDTNSTQLSAIKAKTDSLTFTDANKVDARVDRVGANTVTSPDEFKDWGTTERNQIRRALGLTGTTAATSGFGNLDLVSSSVGIINSRTAGLVEAVLLVDQTANPNVVELSSSSIGAPSGRDDFYNGFLLWTPAWNAVGGLVRAYRIVDYVGATNLATLDRNYEGAWHAGTQDAYILPSMTPENDGISEESTSQSIKTKTDTIPANPAATGDAMTLTAAYDAAKTAAQAGDAMALTAGERNSVADATLDRADGIETGWTLRKAFRLVLAALSGKLSGANTTTVVVRDVNDTKDRLTATVDEHGNRSAVTQDGD